MKNETLRILVIGADHYNTLAAMRSLGRSGISFDLLIHSEESADSLKLAKSQFAPASISVVPESANEMAAEIRRWLGDNLQENTVIYPCSDLSERVVDTLDSCVCLYPGFRGDRGKVSQLMDKDLQSRWASSAGIPVAKGEIVVLRGSFEPRETPFGYPCILKPLVSAEGRKSDIAVASSFSEYKNCLSRFLSNGYERVLVQELIDFDAELSAFGCIFEDGSYVSCVLEKTLIWPTSGGSMAEGRIVADEGVRSVVEKIINVLKNQRYSGPFDVDLFVKDNRVLFNEINFRQSGLAYVLLGCGIDFPAKWVSGACDCSSKDILTDSRLVGSYHINELLALGSTRVGVLSVFDFGIRILRSRSKAFFAADDFSGTMAWYSPKLKRILRRLRR